MFHKYEEPVISGSADEKGSGAVFFAGCNLKCVFCQNYKISHEGKGKIVGVKRLAKIFKKLEKHGALNINLVTPTHYTEQIKQALNIYKPNIPIVWNSGGYETASTIESLRGYVDVFLVDMKYADNELATRYSKAPNYVENCKAAIKKMKELQPQNIIENGHMKRGLIIRHLILPTHTDDSKKCLDFIANEIGKKTMVSIMSQYEPVYKASEYLEVNRKITPLEYKRVESYALKLGLTNAYTQELSSADSKYTPKF